MIDIDCVSTIQLFHQLARHNNKEKLHWNFCHRSRSGWDQIFSILIDYWDIKHHKNSITKINIEKNVHRSSPHRVPGLNQPKNQLTTLFSVCLIHLDYYTIFFRPWVNGGIKKKWKQKKESKGREGRIFLQEEFIFSSLIERIKFFISSNY